MWVIVASVAAGVVLPSFIAFGLDRLEHRLVDPQRAVRTIEKDLARGRTPWAG